VRAVRIFPQETGLLARNLRKCRHFVECVSSTARDCGGWLGRQDSNLGMAESKSAALPLGYAPSVPPGASARDGTRARTIVGPPFAITPRSPPTISAVLRAQRAKIPSRPDDAPVASPIVSYGRPAAGRGGPHRHKLQEVEGVQHGLALGPAAVQGVENDPVRPADDRLTIEREGART
jgi:hypothetical protein